MDSRSGSTPVFPHNVSGGFTEAASSAVIRPAAVADLSHADLAGVNSGALRTVEDGASGDAILLPQRAPMNIDLFDVSLETPPPV